MKNKTKKTGILLSQYLTSVCGISIGFIALLHVYTKHSRVVGEGVETGILLAQRNCDTCTLSDKYVLHKTSTPALSGLLKLILVGENYSLVRINGKTGLG